MAIRILLDARKLGDGGVGVYLENLIDGIVELNKTQAPGIDVSLLISSEAVVRSSYVSDCMKRWRQHVGVVTDTAPKYSVDEYFFLPIRKRKLFGTFDLFHSAHYTLPFFLKIPTVVTIHDIIHVSHPDTYYHKPVAKALIGSSLARACHVITVSQSSAHQIQKYFPRSDLSITVIPNALRRGMEVLDRSRNSRVVSVKQEKNDYLLFVGSERPHKNFKNLLHAFSTVSKQQVDKHNRVLELVVVGKCFSGSTKQLIAGLGLEKRVRFVDIASNEELLSLYMDSAAVVVPSLEEGFGLVALEGLAAGAAMVCTPVAALNELCEQCAWYSDGYDSASIAEVISRMFGDPKEREQKILNGQARARMFSRIDAARRTLGVYERVLGRGIVGSENDEILSRGAA